MDPRPGPRLDKRSFLAVLALLLAAGSPGVSEAPAAPRAGLNLLLITVDTLRADRVSCYDRSHVMTPSIDGLATTGTVFTRAFSHAPLTLPAHASLLLGQTPPAHGVHDNGRFTVREESLTLAEHLKGLGYATGAFIGGYPLHSRFGLGQGFDVYDDRFAASPGVGREFAERRAGAVADAALAWVKERRSPWFLWVHLYDPHDPYEPPEPFRTKFKDAPYDGEVAYADETAGRLFAFLRQAGLEDGTMVVLTGDHGESLGEHGELTHGFLAYNATLWVPLIIRVPGKGPSRVDQTVSHVDVFATVCDGLGLARPGGLEGRSLLPAMEGRRLPPPLVYFECLSPYYGRGWAPIRGHLDGRLKFIESPVPELYDLEKDFNETSNLAATRDLSKFRRSLDRLLLPEATSPKDGAGAKLDAAAVERLKSLGYVAGPAAPKRTAFGPADDVKALLPFHEKAMAALALSREGRYAEAVERLEEVIKARPDLDVARVNLALVHEAAGRVEQARTVLLDGLKALPVSYDLLTHAIGFHIAAGEHRAAVDLAASRPLPQMETDPKFWVDLGICYRNLRDYDKARAAYETALAIDPTYPVIHNNLGTLELAVARERSDAAATEKAIAHFERAIELDPDYAAAHYGLGQARYRRREFAQAVAALKKAAELEPGLADAQFFLGMAYYQQGLYAEALPELEAYRKSAERSLAAADLRKLDGVIAECRARK